jgi:dienelactone hydrolase
MSRPVISLPAFFRFTPHPPTLFASFSLASRSPARLLTANLSLTTAMMLAGFSLATVSPSICVAQPAPDAGTAPADKLPLKDLDGHFPFAVPESAEQWRARAEAVTRQVRVALGIHPLPPMADPIATIHSKRDMDGYSIEKVILESLPGHYVTGSLYRPIGEKAENAKGRPAVLYAHGHWDNGRFYEASPAAVKVLLARGEERFENAAINHMQAACVQLARMGCVVLQYDMIGYADSQQISFDRGHRWGIGIDNPEPTDGGWALFSTMAEGYGQSVMGLQTINTIQAFEMLRRLEDVDPDRIAITGASGGGTQSFIASAVEPRLAGSMPAVMVSTAMQGGCVCENACGLRVGTGNIELAGLTAPRPLAMTTANDWTIDMPKDGYPELVKLYQLVGKPGAVELYPGAHFPHNYNHVTRVSMYGWINRLFGLGMSEPILETDFELLRSADLTVWDQDHPRPPSGFDFEHAFCRRWAAEIDAALRPSPNDSDDVRAEKLAMIRDGWRSITAWADLTRGYSAHHGTIERVDDPHEVSGNAPADVYLVAGPHSPGSVNESAVAWEKSIAAKHAAAGDRSVWKLSASDPAGSDENGLAPLVKNPRPAAAYTYGYNAPPEVRRLGVLLDGFDKVRGSRDTKIRLIATDDQILLAVLAAVERPDVIESVVWVTGASDDFDPMRGVTTIRDPNFMPNGLRLQGMQGLAMVLGDRLQRVAP